MDSKNADRLINTYADMILRISFMYLKQTCDAEDICQDIFLKLLSGEYTFDSPAHEKSWIIRTTINACKDHLRTATDSRTIDGIDIQYNCDEYLVLPSEDYELDEAVKNRMETDDHFFVSYGSNEEETIIYKGVSFEQNGIFYHLYSSDNIGSEELFQMAAELIN